MPVRIRQCRTLRCFHPKLLQPPFTAAQSSDDLPPRLRIPQLTTQHGHKMIPACETTSVSIGLCLLQLLIKLVSGEILEPLRHDAAKSFHGTESSSLIAKLGRFADPIQGSVPLESFPKN